MLFVGRGKGILFFLCGFCLVFFCYFLYYLNIYLDRNRKGDINIDR